MRVGLETLDDVDVSSDDREALSRTVSERAASAMFAGVRDLRLRLRRTQDALLCVAMVGFAGGELVTSTATSSTPLAAVVEALDGLPERMGRMHRIERNDKSDGHGDGDQHAAVRAELKRLLDRA